MDESQLTRLEQGAIDKKNIQMVIEWSDNNQFFDASFIHSLAKSCEQYGSLTPGQRRALENIISKWEIEGDDA